MTRICHALIAKTAKEITFAAYEILAHDDKFYKAWPNQRRFVARQWKNFIGHARASLVVMLQPIPGTEKDPDGPKYATAELMRDLIEDALITEGAFKHVPMPAMQGMDGRIVGGSSSAAEIARHGGLN
jgi:hypothetical protein